MEHMQGVLVASASGGNRAEGIQVPQYQKGTETKGNWGQCTDRGSPWDSVGLCVPHHH